MPNEVTDHEPHQALYSESSDGLSYYRFLVELLKLKLKPRTGFAYLEIAENRAETTDALFKKAGFYTAIEMDLAGRPRYLYID